MDHLEGAGLARGDRVDFDRRVRLEFRGAQISSDGGLLLMRELDDVLGLSNLASEALRDSRTGKNTLHRLDGLFRQSVFGRLAGYEDVNDADRLALDPVMRMTTIHAQAERKRQDRSVCRAEKRLCRARMLRVRGLIHPTSAVCATTDTARGEKRLPSEQNQAILKSSGRPLGECRLIVWPIGQSWFKVGHRRLRGRWHYQRPPESQKLKLSGKTPAGQVRPPPFVSRIHATKSG